MTQAAVSLRLAPPFGVRAPEAGSSALQTGGKAQAQTHSHGRDSNKLGRGRGVGGGGPQRGGAGALCERGVAGGVNCCHNDVNDVFSIGERASATCMLPGYLPRAL